jgi:predicted 3-demethylubiquinone-9 3-methyltransferase (glyoxalase superfamily)
LRAVAVCVVGEELMQSTGEFLASPGSISETLRRRPNNWEAGMPSITPSLWFDQNLEDAARFYTSVFPNSHIEGFNRTTDAGPGEPGTVLSGSFVLDGTRFIGINGGPAFSFSEAVSFTVHCKDQDEVDYYWDRLTDGGEESQCGWLKDRFGLSWQIVPDRLYELIGDPDRVRAAAATEALYGMRRIVIADLEDAAESAGERTR